jgi:hypothetical protein
MLVAVVPRAPVIVPDIEVMVGFANVKVVVGAPPGVVTITVAAPASGGVVAVIWVALTTVNVGAATPSKVTAVAPVTKFVPTIITVVPPGVRPYAGVILVMVGIAVYVYAFVPVAVPPGVVITMVTNPNAWAGAVAVICVSLTTVRAVAAVPPRVTPVVPIRFVPVIVTLLPPAIGPAPGAMLVKVGIARYVYAPLFVAVWPSLLVITTSLAPAVPAGVTAVIVVAAVLTTLVAGTPPIFTPNKPPATKFVPVIVIAVPPAIGPAAGATVVIVGAAVVV